MPTGLSAPPRGGRHPTKAPASESSRDVDAVPVDSLLHNVHTVQMEEEITRDGWTVVDGSILEGGGQILRNAAAYSALLGFPLKVDKIRAGRDRPGLQRQHMLSLKTVAAMTRASVSGISLGSTTATLRPGPLQHGKYLADTGTAGSCMLLAQAALPCALFAPPEFGDVVLDLRGGTDATKAPPVGYMQEVLFPTLERVFGVRVRVERVFRGFYPKGNGQVVLRVTPVPRATPLPACDLTERGVVEELWVESFVAGRAPATAGRAMAGAACAALGERGPREMGLREGVRGRQRGVVELGGGEAFGNGSGVMAWARTSTEMLMGAARPGEVGKEEEIGREAGSELARALASGGCVDEWLQDQLIIFMALADGVSRMTTCEPTLHTRTAIAVAEAVTQARFSVRELRCGAWEIEARGIGFSR